MRARPGHLAAPAASILRPMVPPELSSVAVLSMEDTAVGGIRTSAAILRVLDRIAEIVAAPRWRRHRTRLMIGRD
jgi:hypothetical protein